MHRPWGLLPALAIVLAAMAPLGCRSAPPPRNVLLISIDSLRADRVGAYGNSHATTPTLDRLAAEGVLFENAASVSSWTLPSHVSLLTGRTQVHHRTVRIADSIPSSEVLLTEVFRRHGYETAGIYSGPFLDPTYGFDRGFEKYVNCESPETAALGMILSLTSSHGDRTNACVKDAFADWAASRSDRPFFAFVHMWDVHYDYIPPEPYASMFDPSYRGRLDGRNILGSGFPLRAPRRDVDHLLALYDGELRYTDDTIGAMLAALEQHGLLDDTLVVVTGDHGEQFLEHGHKGHQWHLFQELVHVPLIFWAHSGVPHGQRVSQPVSLVDVAPTILAVLGLPPLDSADGIALLPLRSLPGAERPVFGMLCNGMTGDLLVTSVREGDVKVMKDERNGQLLEYDLRRDPGEKAPRKPAADSPLVVTLDRHIEEARAALASDRADHENPKVLDPALTERLRSLGYLH